MDARWLVLAVAVIWLLCQGIRRLRIASRRIDADIAACNREHSRTVGLAIH